MPPERRRTLSEREDLAESPDYYRLRNQIMTFLYEKFAHDDAAPV